MTTLYVPLLWPPTMFFFLRQGLTLTDLELT